MISAASQALGVAGEDSEKKVALPQHDAPEVNLSFSASGVTDATKTSEEAAKAAKPSEPVIMTRAQKKAAADADVTMKE